jgi:hypothetical protein
MLEACLRHDMLEACLRHAPTGFAGLARNAEAFRLGYSPRILG